MTKKMMGLWAWRKVILKKLQPTVTTWSWRNSPSNKLKNICEIKNETQPVEKKIIVESPWISRGSQIRGPFFESCVEVTFHRTSDTRKNLFSMLFLITVIKTFVIWPVAKICPNTRINSAHNKLYLYSISIPRFKQFRVSWIKSKQIHDEVDPNKYPTLDE